MQKNLIKVIAELKQGFHSQQFLFSVALTPQSLYVLRFFARRGFIQQFIVLNARKRINVYAVFCGNNPLVQEFVIFFKPTQSKHLSCVALANFTKHKRGIFFLDTSFGLLTHAECLFLGIGGVLLFMFVV